jgi:hypothetical protein
MPAAPSLPASHFTPVSQGAGVFLCLRVLVHLTVSSCDMASHAQGWQSDHHNTCDTTSQAQPDRTREFLSVVTTGKGSETALGRGYGRIFAHTYKNTGYLHTSCAIADIIFKHIRKLDSCCAAGPNPKLGSVLHPTGGWGAKTCFASY